MFVNAQCDDDEDEKRSLLPTTDWRMDVRVAYYHPTSKQVRDIFSGGWIDYQFEISRKHCFHNNSEIFMSVDWAHKKGNLPSFPKIIHHGIPKNFHNGTKAHIAPLTIGFKHFYRFNSCIESYVGIGICYTLITVRNQSEFHDYDLGPNPYKRYVYKNSVGGILKIGYRYSLGKCTFFDFFADYYITERVRFAHDELSRKRLNFSGVKTGAGIGVYF